jgi:NADPH-dependent curcumin reductase CurA
MSRSEWLQSGKIVHEETIMDGFDQIPAAFAALFVGGNTGKMLVGAKL